jgi:hypothetical protein
MNFSEKNLIFVPVRHECPNLTVSHLVSAIFFIGLCAITISPSAGLPHKKLYHCRSTSVDARRPWFGSLKFAKLERKKWFLHNFAGMTIWDDNVSLLRPELRPTKF